MIDNKCCQDDHTIIPLGLLGNNKHSEISKRGGTAPRPEKQENILIPSRVPTSSSKYNMSQGPSTKISIKGSGYSSNPKEPIRTTNTFNADIVRYSELRPTRAMESPLPEDIEHV